MLTAVKFFLVCGSMGEEGEPLGCKVHVTVEGTFTTIILNCTQRMCIPFAGHTVISIHSIIYSLHSNFCALNFGVKTAVNELKGGGAK